MFIRHMGEGREVWTHCDRCWHELPVSRLTSQKGLLLCQNCYDNLLVEERQFLIQEVLSDGEELLDVVGEERAVPTEIPEL